MNLSKATGSRFVDFKGTAAPAFHLSSTLDWSSVSARTKNQVVIPPIGKVVQFVPASKMRDPLAAPESKPEYPTWASKG